METIKLDKKFESYEDFKKFVEDAIPNTWYKTVDFQYESVKIDAERDGTFSWTLERNFKIMGITGYTFPMRNTNYVKTFKTLAGCKKNLIKYVEFCFNRDNY